MCIKEYGRGIYKSDGMNQMGQILALALQSMQHDMKRVERIGVNLANATTPGYKREMVIERPFSDMVAAQISSANFPDIDNSAIGLEVINDQRIGTLKPTGQKLDIALTSIGFFQVATANGPAYTRQGNFQVDARGRLVTLQGDPVMGKNGEIILTSNQPRIDGSGRIFDASQKQDGVSMSDGSTAQLKIVHFDKVNPSQKNQYGMFVVDEDVVASEVKNPQVLQGYLENSNVSSMEEMVHLMQTMRHFESMQKVAQGYDDMMGTAIRRLGETS